METRFDGIGFIKAITILGFATIIIALFVVTMSMAKKRGRSQFGWFLFSLIFSPILSMILLFLLGETENKRRRRLIDDEKLNSANKQNNDFKKCSQCAELIKCDAVVCRYCGFDGTIFNSIHKNQNSFEEWKKDNPNGTLNDYYRLKI